MNASETNSLIPTTLLFFTMIDKIKNIKIMVKENLILTQSQLNKILKWIPNTEQEKHDERILKYLQEASKAMKEKWPENSQILRVEKVKSLLSPEQQRYEDIKNADQKKRKEMIEEAERFVNEKRIKEYPIELKSAAILSENLHGNKIQLEFQASIRADEKKKTLQQNQIDMLQSVSWLEDGFQHRTNAFRIAKQHKKELLDSIVDRKRQRDDEKSKRIAEEKIIIEMHNRNIEEEKIKCRKAKEEQNEYMRKHEIETVLMAKQKRDRMKRENEVIDVLAKVHNEGKGNVKDLIKLQENRAQLERIKLIEKLQQMAKLRVDEEILKLKNEQKLIENARIEKEKMLDCAQEKAKNKKNFLKNDRMEDYAQSIKAAEFKRSLKKEEDKEYFKIRISNDFISREYAKAKKEQKYKKIMENTNFLKKQANEIYKLEQENRKADMREFNQRIDDESAYLNAKFFENAKDLIDDAAGKNRPTKPILQVVKSYKNCHFIDINKRTRPHEISNVPIEMELHKSEGDWGKTKRRLKYEKEEKLMKNVYRSSKFLNYN